jgi:hypothetical protein
MRIDGDIKYKSRNLFFQVRNISFKSKKQPFFELFIQNIKYLAWSDPFGPA